MSDFRIYTDAEVAGQISKRYRERIAELEAQVSRFDEVRASRDEALKLVIGYRQDLLEARAQVSQLEAQQVPLDEYRSEYSKKGCYFPHPLGLIHVLEEALEAARAQVSQLTAQRDQARQLLRGLAKVAIDQCGLHNYPTMLALKQWDVEAEPALTAPAKVRR